MIDRSIYKDFMLRTVYYPTIELLLGGMAVLPRNRYWALLGITEGGCSTFSAQAE